VLGVPVLKSRKKKREGEDQKQVQVKKVTRSYLAQLEDHLAGGDRLIAATTDQTLELTKVFLAVRRILILVVSAELSERSLTGLQKEGEGGGRLRGHEKRRRRRRRRTGECSYLANEAVRMEDLTKSLDLGGFDLQLTLETNGDHF